MRIEFDASHDPADALSRAKARKKVGRKHNHQPRGRAFENRQQSVKRAARDLVETKRKYTAKVRAYWLGQRETHP
jgi:uncharacterized MAPEG superfamily protein